MVRFFRGGYVHFQRIKDLRDDKDLTQTQMGEILSCSQRAYSHYERGDIDVLNDVLIKLADFHNTSTDYILGRTNDITPLKS